MPREDDKDCLKAILFQKALSNICLDFNFRFVAESPIAEQAGPVTPCKADSQLNELLFFSSEKPKPSQVKKSQYSQSTVK